MGTSNFSRLKNASKYYTIFMDIKEKFVKCDECDTKFLEWESEYEEIESTKCCTNCKSSDLTFDEEYRSLESWEIDDWKSYFRECLENVGGTYEDEEVVHDRNRPAQYLGYFQQSKFYGEEEFTVRLRMYYHCGYYEGANLDYDIEIEGMYGWEEVDEELWNGSKVTIEDIVTNSLEGSDLPKGMQKIQAKNAMKWIEKVKVETSEKIENLFSEVCDNRLELVGTFSNGESIYREIK